MTKFNKYVPTYQERSDILVAKRSLDEETFGVYVKHKFPKLGDAAITEHNLAIWDELVPIAKRLNKLNSRAMRKKHYTNEEKARLATYDTRYSKLTDVSSIVDLVASKTEENVSHKPISDIISGFRKLNVSDTDILDMLVKRGL